MTNVLSSYEEKNEYRIYLSESAGLSKYVRPINTSLFIFNEEEFNKSYKALKTVFKKIELHKKITQKEKILIDKTIYTIQQSIGAGLDLLVNPNSARKHVGNRFEELIKVIFSEIGVTNKKLVLQIPYETYEGPKTYKCENDLILSP